MYRQFFLASAGAIALAGSAFAADLPSRAPPPVYLPPVPIFTWTGIYVGGQVGYGWGTGTNQFSGFDGAGGYLNSTAGNTPSGVIGGAHVGYQYQINQWVLGLEGSIDGTSLSNTAVAGFPGAFGGGGANVTARTTADIQGSIRGKLGVAWDRALIYVTGGAAFGGFNTNASLNGVAGGVPFFANGSTSSTRVGWTVGGGIQYAVTNNWWVFAEYRFTDFGSINDGVLGLPAGANFRDNHRLQQNQVQVGFSYRFDMFNPAGPVVAKY